MRVVLLIWAAFCMFDLSLRPGCAEGKNECNPKRFLLHRPSKHTSTELSFQAIPITVVMESRTNLTIVFLLTLQNVLCSAKELCLDFKNGQSVYNLPLKNLSINIIRQSCFLMAGNINPNPGPVGNCLSTPLEFSDRSGLGVLHLNVRSLMPKVDHVKIWAKTTKTDILVLGLRPGSKNTMFFGPIGKVRELVWQSI